MLCFQCRRIAASLVRRVPTATGNGLTRILMPQVRTRASLPTRVLPGSSLSNALRRYSTATDTASNTAADPADASGATTLPEKPDYLDDAESAIWDKLVAAFSPTELSVQDISGGCGSMYGIEITSEKFRGAAMLKQQRMVNAVLGDEMKGWHGVQLRTKIP